jgi:transcriptional regulator with XRE-family HTH domain
MNLSRLPDIIGAEIKSARIERGLEQAELAKKCCLSSKMILELEEGGMNSFYSFELKLAAAKRVGAYLGLSQSDFLLQKVLPSENLPIVESPDLGLPDAIDKSLLDTPPSAPRVDIKKSAEELLEGSKIAEESELGEPRIAKRFRATPAILVAVLSVGLLYGISSGSELSDIVQALTNRLVTRPVAVQAEAIEVAKPDTKEGQVDSAVNNPESIKSVEQVAAVASQSQCPYAKDDQLVSYQSPNPSKAGDTVNIKTLVKQTICVTDGLGKQVVANLEANAAQAFKGVAPFTILSQDLDNVEMYYQGWRVRSQKPGASQIKLVEVSTQQTP